MAEKWHYFRSGWHKIDIYQEGMAENWHYLKSDWQRIDTISRGNGRELAISQEGMAENSQYLLEWCHCLWSNDCMANFTDCTHHLYIYIDTWLPFSSCKASDYIRTQNNLLPQSMQCSYPSVCQYLCKVKTPNHTPPQKSNDQSQKGNIFMGKIATHLINCQITYELSKLKLSFDLFSISGLWVSKLAESIKLYGQTIVGPSMGGSDPPPPPNRPPTFF